MENILITGSPRVGKTTLAKKISKELNYIYISLDNISNSIETLNCWPYKKYEEAKIISGELANFLINFINGLDKENNYVLEGAYIDIEKIFSKINNVKIIGLTYNKLNKNTLFERIKKYDKNTWINNFSDEVILEKCDCFIKRNNYYNKCFKKLNINAFDLSDNFNNMIEEILNKIR